jgi:hypothetical protein
VLFGDSSDAVLSWAETAAAAFGQTQQQALDAAANFAIFGQAAGLSGADLVGFSTELTELATDLASFNNTSPDEAINALGAALRGESEPLRAYGVLLDDATLRQRALTLGLVDDTKEALTQQDRILAAQAEIWEQTKVQQGDFERTSEGLANSKRTLAAAWEDFQTRVGAALAPVVQEAVGGLNDVAARVLPGIVTLISERVAPALEGAAVRLGELFDWVMGLADGLSGAQDDLSSYADDVGRVWGESALRTQENINLILANLKVFSSWFGGDEAGAAIGWAANVMAVLMALTEAATRQAAYLTTAFRLVGEAGQALMRGDFAAAGQAAAAANALLSAVGVNDMISEFQTLLAQARAELREELQDEQAQVGYTPQIEPVYNFYLPITINAGAGTDAQAVSGAAQGGVTQALRALGLQ